MRESGGLGVRCEGCDIFFGDRVAGVVGGCGAMICFPKCIRLLARSDLQEFLV